MECEERSFNKKIGEKEYVCVHIVSSNIIALWDGTLSVVLWRNLN